MSGNESEKQDAGGTEAEVAQQQQQHEHGASERPSSSQTTSRIDTTANSRPATAGSATTAPPPRVRFSTELDRGQLAGAGGGSKVVGSGLTLDTSTSTTGQNAVTSPTSVTSSLSAASSSSFAQPTRTLTTTSSGSKTRSRGYSLRRNIFNRNLQSPLEDEGSDIELGSAAGEAGAADASLPRPGTAGPSVQKPSSSLMSIVRSREKNKSQDSTVTTVVSVPKSDEEDGLPSEAPLKGWEAMIPPHLLPKPETRWKRSLRRLDIFSATAITCRNLAKKAFAPRPIPPTADGRHIDLDFSRGEVDLVDERTGHNYISNTIRSSRYTLWSFFPRQLIFQFSKLANFYFLCLSILQMIPGLSTTGTYTTIVPLLIFVAIAMAKEGYDDLRRYKLDKEENNRFAKVLKAGCASVSVEQLKSEAEALPEDGLPQNAPFHWAEIPWKDIKVGDVIKLSRNDSAPADLALLHADGPNGIAYIETMALDGETNLKTKQASPAIAKHCKTVTDILSCRAELVAEDPNMNLYSFEGRISVAGSETMPLTNNEIVYRGSTLRNTSEAIGMTIYTGEECKIRMNANKNPRTKAPSLQAIVNRVVIMIVCFVIALALFCTVAYQVWANQTEKHSWYIADAGVPFGDILASFIIMFNTMIPLSLYVSMEIVKVFQMMLLNDIDMYDETTDTPLEARTSTINEELGQVSYIFSDKTGTLTNNSMRFRKMSVAGTAWLHDPDLQEEAMKEAEREHLYHKKRNGKGKKPASRKSFAVDAVKNARKSIASRLSIGTETGPARNNSVSTAAQRYARKIKSHRGGKTEEMLEYIQTRPNTVFAKRVRFFLLSLALCHTCIPECDEEGELSFQAASPDESALVNAAKEMGYIFADKETNTVTIKTYPSGFDEDPVLERYEVLDVIEFSSARKRMSIVVRMPDNRICVFCKGADTTIMKLLRQSKLAGEKAAEIGARTQKRKSMEMQQALRRQSEQRGRNSGIRTSMSVGRRSGSMAPRQSMQRSVDQWLKDREMNYDTHATDANSVYYSPRPSAQIGASARHSLASSSEGRPSFQTDTAEDLVEEALVINDDAVFERCFQHIDDFATEGLRTLLYVYKYIDEAEYAAWKKDYLEASTSLVDRQHKIEKVGERLETSFELVGATAIEDKLQVGVPEAIEKLRRANIKLWMLTGDKRETAINIGYSCRLVKDYSTLTILDHANGSLHQGVVDALVRFSNKAVVHSVVVVDGATLGLIDADPVVHELFINLAIIADSVICCRASPSQKAALVRAIRKRVKKSITLAIGDGANDIAMIQEAHVGIGITGKEGLQAARTSDYSIAQFRFLLKLLLVHGRWNYLRICKYTLGTFWKEMLFYLTQALYQRWNGYSGTSLYESWSLSMFNTLFTSLPVIFLGIFEKDLAASTLLAVPELYTKGQRNEGFNVRLYLWWTFLASCEAVIIFCTMWGLFGRSLFTKDNGLFAMGDLTFTTCIILISTKLQFLEIHNKSVTAAISIFCSVGGWFLWNLILSQTYHKNEIYNVKDGFTERFGSNLMWWLTVILAVMACVLFETTISAARASLFPEDVDIFQALEQDIDVRKRFEEAAADELQQGWARGTKKSSLELLREEEEQFAREKEEEEREAQIMELLNRPRIMKGDSSRNIKGNRTSITVGGLDGSSTNDHHKPTAVMEGEKLRHRRSGSHHDDIELAIAVDGAADSDADSEANHGHPTASDTSRTGSIATAARRRSLDAQELFKKGFGTIWKGQDLK